MGLYRAIGIAKKVPKNKPPKIKKYPKKSSFGYVSTFWGHFRGPFYRPWDFAPGGRRLLQIGARVAAHWEVVARNFSEGDFPLTIDQRNVGDMFPVREVAIEDHAKLHVERERGTWTKLHGRCRSVLDPRTHLSSGSCVLSARNIEL